MADLKYYDIIFKPIMTEEAMKMFADKKYCFYVHPDANKVQVKEAIEKLFDGVKVKRVNIMNLKGKEDNFNYLGDDIKGKIRRRGRIVGKTNKRKKAIIFLSGESKEIELFKK